tara:strand:- start:2146 stop:2751 length:606 start_codon:yes stop_codon:yes gene_type:complete
MTSLMHLYRDFGDSEERADPGLPAAISQDALEDIKLESFERGYSAGWEDALKAQSGSRTEAANAFIASLQDISFGYHEARAGLVKAMQPVLTDIMAKLLPEVAHATLGAQVVEQLIGMLRKAADQPIRIEATQDNLDMLEQLLDAPVSPPFVCAPNSDLGPSQVLLQVGSEESEIDFDQVISGIAAAMTGFVQQMQKELTP